MLATDITADIYLLRAIIRRPTGRSEFLHHRLNPGTHASNVETNETELFITHVATQSVRRSAS